MHNTIWCVQNQTTHFNNYRDIYIYRSKMYFIRLYLFTVSGQNIEVEFDFSQRDNDS